MKRLTGSVFERAMACPASLVLPHVYEEREPAQVGRVVHAFLADISERVNGGESVGDARELALESLDPADRMLCEGLPLDHLPIGPGFRPEVAFAYDWQTDKARELGSMLDRNYPDVADTEVVATADVFGLMEGGGVYIADFKSGHGKVTSATRNPQLRLLALAACRATGQDHARVALLFVREDGTFGYDEADLDIFDLEGMADVVRSTAARVAGAAATVARGQVPDVYMGDHCRYCPVALASCPGRAGMLRALVDGTQAQEYERWIPLSRETAAIAYKHWRLAEQVLSRIKEALYAFASQQPIDVGEGRVFGPVETKRDNVLGEVAHRVIAAKLGRKVADSACTFDSSKAAIKRAITPIAKERGIPVARLERELLEEISRAGGIETKVTTTIKEYKA